MDALTASTQLAVVGMANQLVSAASAGDQMRDTLIQWFEARLSSGEPLSQREALLLLQYARHSTGYLDQLRDMVSAEHARKRKFSSLLEAAGLAGTPE